MKGKIPVTSEIILESSEEKWRLLTRGLINELKTSGLVERTGDFTVRLKLTIIKIVPPEQTINEVYCQASSNISEAVGNGLSRISEYLIKMLEDKKWLFIGFIEGENRVPILITHYPYLGITIYTQKLKGEEAKDFSHLAQLN